MRSLVLCLVVIVPFLSGCGSFLPSEGASTTQVVAARTDKLDDSIRVVQIDAAVARRVSASSDRHLFSHTLATKPSYRQTVGLGDVVEISVWEAPPATLFATSSMDAYSGNAIGGRVIFPEQMVNEQGTVSIPFAGTVPVAGRTLTQIEELITKRLTGKANQPQVLVRLIQDSSSTVTVVGDVGKSTRMPLTAKGERLLDALASAGGVSDAVDKVSVQVTRGRMVHTLPLSTIIRDPAQNIILQKGDVITAMKRPLSFTVLGATGKNEEVDFEAKGISLAQALARAGGLNDNQADATGVFLFRFEHPWVFADEKEDKDMEPQQRIPVVYRLNLTDPGAFFVAQKFPMRDKDVLFVSNASAVELNKFFTIFLRGAATANLLD